MANHTPTPTPGWLDQEMDTVTGQRTSLIDDPLDRLRLSDPLPGLTVTRRLQQPVPPLLTHPSDVPPERPYNQTYI